MGTREDVFGERVVEHRLPGEGVGSPSLEGFERGVTCLGTWFRGGLGSVQFTVDSVILKVFFSLNDSMILR